MKKLLMLLTCVGLSVSTFAATNASGPAASSTLSCKQIRQQYLETHTKIRLAVEEQDADTLGKLQLQNRKLFNSHRQCFRPKVTMAQ